MITDIKNKIAVVTGGANGIGYEIADRFLLEGAKTVIILDLNEKEGEIAENELNKKHGNNRAVFYKCDVTTDMDAIWKELISTYKYIDILVNNAGILNEKNPKKCIDINVTALIEWSLKFCEQNRMDKSGKGGTIINVASVYGLRTDQFSPVYQSSKYAAVGFSKSLGNINNFKRTGVRVVALCPGFTQTKLIDTLSPWDDTIKNVAAEFVKDQPWQNADAVGSAAFEVFQIAESGTAWVIEGGQPIEKA